MGATIYGLFLISYIVEAKNKPQFPKLTKDITFSMTTSVFCFKMHEKIFDQRISIIVGVSQFYCAPRRAYLPFSANFSILPFRGLRR